MNFSIKLGSFSISVFALSTYAYTPSERRTKIFAPNPPIPLISEGCLIKNSNKSRQKHEKHGQNCSFSEFLMRTEPRGERIWSRNPWLTSEKRTKVR